VADIEASPTFGQRASSHRAVGTLDGLRGAFLRSVTGCRAARGGGHGDVRLKFQLANIGSALVWAAGILGPGVVGIRWLIG
jgi:hypothetical protein